MPNPPDIEPHFEDDTNLRTVYSTPPSAATVDQERIDAAVRRIKHTLAYLDRQNDESVYSQFSAERLALRQALDLLDPEVQLA